MGCEISNAFRHLVKEEVADLGLEEDGENAQSRGRRKSHENRVARLMRAVATTYLNKVLLMWTLVGQTVTLTISHLQRRAIVYNNSSWPIHSHLEYACVA